MDKIISIGDFKEKKEQKQRETEQQGNPTYFVMLGNDKAGSTKFRFGGAFIRDFISRMEHHKEELKKEVSLSYKLLLDRLKQDGNASEYVNVFLGKQTILSIVDLITDEFSFDALFENEALASQAGMVLSIALFSHYDFETIEQMHEDTWVDVDLDIVKKIYTSMENS